MKKLLKKTLTVAGFLHIIITASAQQSLEEASDTAVVSKNLVAVVPLQYPGYGNNGMGFYLQEIIVNYLSRPAVKLKLMDLAKVNEVLAKNGINDANIHEYSAKELAVLLHAGYVIVGSVAYTNKPMVADFCAVKNGKQEGPNDVNYRGLVKYKESLVGNQRVDAEIFLKIYNNSGEEIYCKSRYSLQADPGAYKKTLHGLLKKIPLYKR